MTAGRQAHEPHRLAARPGIWLLSFIVILFFIEVGSLASEVIDWDESTFIVVANEMLRGKVLYADVFDNKPPLIFVFFAGVLVAFGKSLAAIRIFGWTCIAMTAALTFLTARRFASTPAAGLATVLMLCLYAVPYWRHSSSELPATALLMAALWFATGRSRAWWPPAAAGLAVSLATLTRTNLAFDAVALGIFYLFFKGRGEKGGTRLRDTAFYTAGGLLPLAVLVAIYLQLGRADVLYLSLVEVPFLYATTKDGILQCLATDIGFLKNIATWFPALAPAVLAFFAAALAGILLAGAKVSRRTQKPAADGMTALLLMTAATFFSIISGGSAYSHYWLQMLGFLGILAALAIDPLLKNAGMALAAATATAASLAGSIWLSAPSAIAVLQDPSGYADDHPIRRTAALVAAEHDAKATVLAVENHLVYWYLDASPPSKLAAHPSSLARKWLNDAFARKGEAGPDELGSVIASRPTYIVTRRGETPAYFEAGFDLAPLLAEHYEPFARVGDVWTYRLR